MALLTMISPKGSSARLFVRVETMLESSSADHQVFALASLSKHENSGWTPAADKKARGCQPATQAIVGVARQPESIHERSDGFVLASEAKG